MYPLGYLAGFAGVSGLMLRWTFVPLPAGLLAVWLGVGGAGRRGTSPTPYGTVGAP